MQSATGLLPLVPGSYSADWAKINHFIQAVSVVTNHGVATAEPFCWPMLMAYGDASLQNLSTHGQVNIQPRPTFSPLPFLRLTANHPCWNHLPHRTSCQTHLHQASRYSTVSKSVWTMWAYGQNIPLQATRLNCIKCRQLIISSVYICILQVRQRKCMEICAWEVEILAFSADAKCMLYVATSYVPCCKKLSVPCIPKKTSHILGWMFRYPFSVIFCFDSSQ